MKIAVLLLVAACACATAQARSLQQAGNLNDPRLTTFNSALKAAGITITDKAWTVLAPTNKAFQDDDLFKKTGLTAAQLLLPANKAKLVQLLQYHVIPAGAFTSAQLKPGQKRATALKGAAPLTVQLDDDGQLEFAGVGDSVEIKQANIKAGKAIVHIVDDVLIPPSLSKFGH